VVTIGDTVFVAPLPNPALHVYEVPPDAVNKMDSPLQMVDASPVLMLTAGGVFTLTVKVAVVAHCPAVGVKV
jgi:hypothetical protein